MTSRFASLSALAALLANLIGAPLCAAGLEGEPASAQLTGTVVVVNQAADTVTLIDVATMEAYRHVPVVGGPHEVAISPDGRRAIVTNYRKRGVGPQKALSLISLPDGAVLKTIDLGKYRAPHDVHWVNGSQVVCTVEDNQALLLVNGMGLAAPLRERYPGIALFCGTTTEGAYALGPRHIRYAGRGETRIGGRGSNGCSVSEQRR